MDAARAQDTRMQEPRAQEPRTPDARTPDTRAQERAPETRAQDNCLAAPSGKPPAGNHWHYRTDPTTQTKCWFLRPAADTAQKPAAQDKAETGATATAPAAATPQAPADPAAQESPQPRPAQVARPAAAGKQTTRRQAAERPAGPWPDPSPQAGAGNVTWPAPPPAAAAAAPEPAAAPQPAAAPLANDRQDAPVPPQSADTIGGADAASNRQATEQATEPVATAASNNDEAPVDLLLALAAALLISGILVRRLVKMLFARRPKVAKIGAERREPILGTNSAGQRTITLPLTHQTDLAPGWVDHLDDDVQSALRKLLRALEREAA